MLTENPNFKYMIFYGNVFTNYCQLRSYIPSRCVYLPPQGLYGYERRTRCCRNSISRHSLDEKYFSMQSPSCWSVVQWLFTSLQYTLHHPQLLFNYQSVQ